MWGQLLVCLPVMALVAFLVRVTGERPARRPTGSRRPPRAAAARARGADRARRAAHRVDHRLRPVRSTRCASRTWPGSAPPGRGIGTTPRCPASRSHAVPTIFTGQKPEEGVEPLFTEHPDNLFRLLAGSHDLVVSEALTRLCPCRCAVSNHRRPAVGGRGRGRLGPRPQLGALVPRRRRPVGGAGRRWQRRPDGQPRRVRGGGGVGVGLGSDVWLRRGIRPTRVTGSTKRPSRRSRLVGLPRGPAARRAAPGRR